MKKAFIIAAVPACVFAALPLHAALVPNGDFELPVNVPANNYLSPGAHIGNAGQGWTVVGPGGVDVHQVNAGSLWNGTQFLDLTGSTAGDPGLGGITSDPITTIYGQQYAVTFDAYNGSLIFPGTAFTGPAFSLQASGGSLVSYTLVPAGMNTPLTYLFTANAVTTTLTFLDLTGFDSNAGWIDNVSLAAVPEATTMIAGALLLLPFGASTIRLMRKNRIA